MYSFCFVSPASSALSDRPPFFVFPVPLSSDEQIGNPAVRGTTCQIATESAQSVASGGTRLSRIRTDHPQICQYFTLTVLVLVFLEFHVACGMHVFVVVVLSPFLSLSLSLSLSICLPNNPSIDWLTHTVRTRLSVTINLFSCTVSHLRRN